MRRIFVLGLALAVLAVVAFVLPTLGLGADAPKKQTAYGKVTVERKGEGEKVEISSITLVPKKEGATPTHIKLDDKGKELAKLEGKVAKATGTIETTEVGGKSVRTMTVEEFIEATPGGRKKKAP